MLETLDRFEAAPAARPAILAAVVGALILLVGLRLAVPIVRGDDRATPATALASVPAEVRRQPVFNEYDFGGYLIFSDVRPIIDGRADMYGDSFMQTYRAAEAGDEEVLRRMLHDYGVTWTLLRPESPSVDILDNDPLWRRHYADKRAVVHVRTASAPTPTAGRSD